MDDTIELLPVHAAKINRGIRLKFRNFAIVTVGLPFFAFMFCVYWSTVYNFRESTATHCQVDNYLPSVSAAIGSFSPQKHVWMGAILLHFYPRIRIAALYYGYLQSIIDSKLLRPMWYTWLLNFVEVICLLGLTLVSSTDFYPAHAFFFMTFILTSITYMLSSCFLLKWRRWAPVTQLESRSLWWKFFLTGMNLSGFFLAGYSFVRHNTHCETGMYSYFAFFEYVVVLSNMAFHMTAYLDFHSKIVYFSSRGIRFS